MAFGGHDHCYHRSLNKKTNVFVQKSGTDFENFTNLTILTGVSENDYFDFKSKFDDQCPKIEAKTKKVKPSEDIELFYSKSLERLFISEKVNITRRFEEWPVVAAHTEIYSK